MKEPRGLSSALRMARRLVKLPDIHPLHRLVLAIEGSIGQVVYNDSTQLFRVPVMAGSTGSATIRIQKPQHGRRHNVSAK